MNATQRKNLLKLAAYLETLPESYQHFDMRSYADHHGDCELPMNESAMAACEPLAFLTNCGTVACAVGHGPAAGVRPKPTEFYNDGFNGLSFDWDDYVSRAFGAAFMSAPFEFMFGAGWKMVDNHHYGAAARIRHLLDGGEPNWADEKLVKKYAPYRKGSRSAKRREIEALAA